MFREPQKGDWADASDEEGDDGLLRATPAPATRAPAAATNYWASRAQATTTPAQEQKAEPRQQQDARAPRQEAGRFDRQGSDRGSDRGFDRNSSDRGYNRGNDRGYDRSDRGGDRGYGGDRGGDRGYDRGGDRGYDRGGDRGYDRGFDRGGDRNLDRGSDRYGSRADSDSRSFRRAPAAPRYEGIVMTLKEDGGFGFLHSLDLDQDVFFHESEVPSRPATDDAAASLPHVQVGDELSFELTINRRNGKESATHMTRLPKGTIVTEDIGDIVETGVVTKGTLPPKHAKGRLGDRPTPEVMGTIELTPVATEATDDAPKPLKRHYVRFNLDSVAADDGKKVIPRVGDDVAFRVAVHKQLGTKRAVDLHVTCSASKKRAAAIDAALVDLERETGIVSSIKGSSGYIKCLSRLQDAFFAYDHKSMGATIKEKTEVSFFILPEHLQAEDRGNAKVTALKLEALPEGSVLFEEIMASSVHGKIVAKPTEPSRQFAKAKPSARGKIAVTDAETPAEYAVDGSEFDANYTPKEGDEVLFDVLHDLRRGEKIAVNVRSVLLNPIGRECGVVTAMKDDFGFLKCVDRPGDAYFRFSDVLQSTYHLTLRMHAEVSFDVIEPTKAKDGIRATRIQLLPKNTIQWETPLDDNIANAVILAVPGRPAFKDHSGDKPSGEAKYGKLSYTAVSCPLAAYPELKAAVLAGLDQSVSDVDQSVTLKQLHASQRLALAAFAAYFGLAYAEERNTATLTQARDAARVSDWAITTPCERTVVFANDAHKDVRYEPSVGDTVRCNVVATKKGGHLVLAKDLVLLHSDAPLSQGWVTAIKADGQYGFLEPTTSSDSVFFHFRDVGEKAKIKVGDEVEYVLKPAADKKTKATQIRVLPPGSLPPKQVVAYEAVVERVSLRPKARDVKKSTAGKLRVVPEAEVAAATDDDEAPTLLLSFHLEDQVDKHVVLRAGDRVRCVVKGSGKAATEVALVASNAKTGVVSAVDESGAGSIQVDGDETPAAFVSKQVLGSSGRFLSVGDKVEFSTNHIGDALHATSIVRLESAAPDRKVAVNSSLRRQLKEATARTAKGPDGTKGFASGWRSQVEEDQVYT